MVSWEMLFSLFEVSWVVPFFCSRHPFGMEVFFHYKGKEGLYVMFKFDHFAPLEAT